MYAKGLSTRQILEQIEDIYGFEVSEGMVSNITNKILLEIEEWQNRPLSRVYPVVFIDISINLIYIAKKAYTHFLVNNMSIKVYCRKLFTEIFHTLNLKNSV